GKAKTPESYEEDLAAFIDIKGMKAQGNRLSSYDIVKVELLSVEEDDDAEETNVPSDPNPSPQNGQQTPTEEGKVTEEREAKDSDSIGENEEKTKADSKDSSIPSEKKVSPKLDLEITNPDEIEIDNKGQINLF